MITFLCRIYMLFLRAGFLVSLFMLVASCSPSSNAPISIDTGRYQKLDRLGNKLPPSAMQWACLRDTHSNLIWENKSDDEGARHVGWTYSWNDQAGFSVGLHAKTEGSCNQRQMRRCTTQAYIEHINRIGHCGLTTWRLPDIRELESITSSEALEMGKAYCDCFFKPTKAHLYWSSSVQLNAQGRGEIKALHFGTGKTQFFDADNYLYLRLVAEENP